MCGGRAVVTGTVVNSSGCRLISPKRPSIRPRGDGGLRERLVIDDAAIVCEEGVCVSPLFLAA